MFAYEYLDAFVTQKGEGGERIAVWLHVYVRGGGGLKGMGVCR